MKVALNKSIIGLFTWLMLQSCIFVVSDKKSSDADTLASTDSSQARATAGDSTTSDSSLAIPDTLTLHDTAKNNNLTLPKGAIDTRNVHPQQVLDYAKTLIGTPYRYGSTNPAVGFDCSGFITHVFSRFSIVVPRSSIDFTNVGKEVGAADAKPGDLILFTGTNPHERFVGHMGIVLTNNNNQLEFIHSTSGKKYGVTITPLNEYYKTRYVKTIRIFPENGI